MNIHLPRMVDLVDFLEVDDRVHVCAGGFRRTFSHVTKAAPPQTTAPMAMVFGTPIQWDRLPASKPPIGIMPPNTSAQIPITRPRILSATLVWIKVLVVEK